MKSEQITGYKALTQTEKNIAWYLPRPKPDHYKGGMPLYAEDWLVNLASDILKKPKEDLEILNLFCGMNYYGTRVDINPEVKPDILCDAHDVSMYIRKNGMSSGKFDFILADPPYSTEESKDLYGTQPIHYKKWTAECDKLLKKGGLLCVYHKYVMPNPDPTKYVVEKRVFIGNRTYHVPRIEIYLRKK